MQRLNIDNFFRLWNGSHLQLQGTTAASVFTSTWWVLWQVYYLLAFSSIAQ